MALKTAEQSKCNQRHGAVVVKNGNVLVRAVNVDKNDPAYICNAVAKTNASVHAEVAALRQIKNPRGCVIYVARKRSNGNAGLSKPCGRCELYLRARGVKVVHT